jgi:hypothetical protein
MSRNAQSASSFYRIPPNRVVELGMQVVLSDPAPERVEDKPRGASSRA